MPFSTSIAPAVNGEICLTIFLTPSAVIIDSASVKTTEVGGTQRGYDAGKKVSGRKRHIVVDTFHG